MIVYTIGHGDRSLEALRAALEAHGVKRLIDTRARPGSHRHPQYCRPALEHALLRAGIGYDWAGGQLGGFRRGATASAHLALRSAALRAYAEHMQGEEFRAAIDRVLAAASIAPTALLCAERLPSRCHRSLIADYLTAIAGVTVLHLIEADEVARHRLHPVARRVGKILLYDKGKGGQLDLNLG